MIDLSKLTTEGRNPDTLDLDRMTPLGIAQAMNREDAKVAPAVEAVLPQVARAIEWCAAALSAGGRIVYVGAGTSGRLGVLDAVECPPTFGVEHGRVVGLIAGGPGAFMKAVEGAEDSPTLCEQDLRAIGLTAADVVVGLAASGRTPYVIHGLRFARAFGCRTIAIACNSPSAVGAEAELAIEPVVGPEALTGSTRLKAGTAQKMVLNMISTGAMVSIGKAYGNMMVDLMQTNAKLKVRAENITMEATGCEREEARAALDAAGGSVKLAVAAIALGCGVEEARSRLEKAGGRIRGVLAEK